MSATALAISSAALSQSTIASMRAAEARRSACVSFVKGYQNDAASEQEMRQYASCVRLLHPEPVSDPHATLMLKAAIVLVFMGMGIGVWWCMRDGYRSVQDFFYGAVIGASCAGAGLGAAYLAVMCIRFLLS